MVVAAGKSSRMGGLDKILAPVLGQPLICYALAQFETFAPVTQVALVLDEESLERGQCLVDQAGYRKSFPGLPWRSPTAGLGAVWPGVSKSL